MRLGDRRMSIQDELAQLRQENEFLRRKVELLDRVAKITRRVYKRRISSRVLSGDREASLDAVTSCYLAVDAEFHVTVMNSKMAALLGIESDKDRTGILLRDVDALAWAPGVLATLLHDARSRGSEQSIEVEHDLNGSKAYKKFTASWTKGTGTIVVDDITQIGRAHV